MRCRSNKYHLHPRPTEERNESRLSTAPLQDPEYKALAQDVHDRWKDLGRKINETVGSSEEHVSSLIYLAHGFIVPGGRFREMYYWDTYWTILGLIHSEMTGTVKGQLL